MRHSPKLLTWLLVVLLVTACTRIRPPATVTPQLPQATPTTSLPTTFHRIVSFHDVKRAKPITSIPKEEDLQYFLSVFTNTKSVHEYFKNEMLDSRIKEEINNEIILAVEWGMYSDGSIKVDVLDVRSNDNKVEVIVQGGRTPSKEASIAAFTSAFTMIAIPRQSLDFNKPITFNLMNKGIVVAQEVLNPQ